MVTSTPGGDQGLRSPLESVPLRRPGVVRRTMHIDVEPPTSFGSSLELVGGARDLLTTSGRGGRTVSVVLATAEVRATFDRQRRLATLVTKPSAKWTESLVGVRAGGGYRSALAESVPTGEEASLLRQVLDDLPAGALISGYAWMRLARRAGEHPGRLMPEGALDRMTDLCSGWRKGGVAVQSVAAGGGVPVQDCPPATDLGIEDADAWHEIEQLAPDWMRRRRLLDVELDARLEPGGFRIWSMFRDTVGEPDGSEVVLHEYAVRARGSGSILTQLEAEPRVLPFPECPGAAPAVDRLSGLDVATLDESVPRIITGVASCTHLNDLLRSLAGTGTLLGVARSHVA